LLSLHVSSRDAEARDQQALRRKPPIVVEEEEQEPPEAEEGDAVELGALDSVPVPEIAEIAQFVKNKEDAILLGKALFWDMQVGGDGRTACASCHFQAGADNRTRNTLSPGGGTTFRGANTKLERDDFPFHRLKNSNEEKSDSNPVIFDTSEVVGSQGVIKKNFVAIVDGSEIDRGQLVPDPVFNIKGVNVRQVTGRNAPTVINAIFNDRQFWDGRANRFFNGVNPFGDMDPEAKVWAYNDASGLTQERILLDNGSLASQAVGPPNNDVEMSWNGRSFPQLGRKMLQLRPLALQKIHPEDSVLGGHAYRRGDGFADQSITYAALIRQAFHERWWTSPDPTPAGDTQMEANFSLFWGLAIQLYEATLVSNDSPFDRYMKGDTRALNHAAKVGLKIFTGQGKCANCHSGPEFSGASISQLRGVLKRDDEPMIELMPMQAGHEAFYDKGFYNIGVRPTAEDLGVGGGHPTLGPWSLARRVQQGQRPNLDNRDVSIGPNDRLAVDGAFKTPTLRNIELTGPYMHNGGMKSLREVVQFYARGADFFHENIDNLDPDVDGFSSPNGRGYRVDPLVEFLKSLTDDRVRYEKAPFDHPELVIPNGHSRVSGEQALDSKVVLKAVGRRGGEALKSFVETLK